MPLVQNLITKYYVANIEYSSAAPVVFTTSGLMEELRTPSVTTALEGHLIVAVNRLDHLNKKSYIILTGYSFLSSDYVRSIRANLTQETALTSNTNYKFTGFPSVAFTSTQFKTVEVAWQQINYTGTNYCTINAISKRYTYDYYTFSFTSLNGNTQFYYLSSDITKNSFYPSMAALGAGLTTCLNYYSFGIIDKTTNVNGKVAYKKVYVMV